MRSYFFFVISLLLLFACTKSKSSGPTPNSIEGKWVLKAVTDIATNTKTVKPTSLNGDVELVFISMSSDSGTFTGRTPINEIWENKYFISPNWQVQIPALSMTKVAESSWGNLFVNNICSSQTYRFLPDNLMEISTIQKRLLFEKR